MKLFNRKKTSLVQVSLQKRGASTWDSYELFLSLSKGNFNNFVLLSSGNELKNKWDSLDSQDKIKWIDTYKNSISDFLLSLIKFKWLKLLNNIYLLRSENILATHFHPWLYFVVILKRFFCKKFIYIVHENPFNPKESDSFIMIWLQKSILTRSDILITHSDKLRDEISPHFKRDILTFPLGSYSHYCENFKTKESTSGVRFLFLGRIESHKGLDLLVDAFCKVKKVFPDSCLTIAGSGLLPNNATPSGNIKILNYWLSDDEISKILENVDVLVLPYRKASQSGVLSIAWGCGIPVISSDAGGLPEQVKDMDNGLVFKNGDFDQLYEKMLLLCSNKELLLKLKDRAKYYGQEVYSWKIVADGVEKLF